MLGTLADLLLVLGANVVTDSRRYMLTVTLHCDFLAPAPLGSWVEGRLQVQRATRNLVFCQGQFTADGAPVLAFTGIAKPSGEPNDRFTRAHYLGSAAASGACVAVGKLADLVLVDGDPTQHIADLRKVALVVTQGSLLSPAAVHQALGIKPFVSDAPVLRAMSAPAPQASHGMTRPGRHAHPH